MVAKLTSRDVGLLLQENGYELIGYEGGHARYENSEMRELSKSRGIELPQNLRSNPKAPQPAWLVIVPTPIKGDGTLDKILKVMNWCKNTLDSHATSDRVKERQRAALREFRDAQKEICRWQKGVRDFYLGRNMVDEMPACPSVSMQIVTSFKFGK